MRGWPGRITGCEASRRREPRVVAGMRDERKGLSLVGKEEKRIGNGN